MTPQVEQTPEQIPLFEVEAGNGAYVYVMTPDGYTWSVRRWSNGEELFTKDGRTAAKLEAEARGYIVRK